jgi:uncharacterized damage-inducible protein DinB
MAESSVTLQFRKLEESKQQLLTLLGSADKAVLGYRPADQKWSIVQILFHLNSSERISLKYMQKKSQGGRSVPKSTPLNAFRSFALNSALRYFSWKKPSILPEPPADLNYDEVVSSWNQTRVELRQFLEDLPAEMYGRTIFRHPAAGRMNLQHALSFMQEHFDHHLKQIQGRISEAKESS